MDDSNDRRLSERVIGCAFTVNNELGAGFLERVDEEALAVEMRATGIQFEQQRPLQVRYRGSIAGNYTADFVLKDRLILEIKALLQLAPQHDAQLMNYLKATHMTVGLLLDFDTSRIAVTRLVSGHEDNNPI